MKYAGDSVRDWGTRKAKESPQNDFDASKMSSVWLQSASNWSIGRGPTRETCLMSTNQIVTKLKLENRIM